MTNGNVDTRNSIDLPSSGWRLKHGGHATQLTGAELESFTYTMFEAMPRAMLPIGSVVTENLVGLVNVELPASRC